jgi:hypothetical protein
MISEATAEPPGELIRKTTAFAPESRTCWNARAMVSAPMTSPPKTGTGE